MTDVQWYEGWLKVAISGIFIATMFAIGCAAPEQGVLSDIATDAGQTFHVQGVFRISRSAALTQVVVEGHQYIMYSNTIGGGGLVHSASCPHPSHPGMGEIY